MSFQRVPYFRSHLAVAVIVGLGIVAVLNAWQHRLSARQTTRAAELREARTQWAKLSVQLEDARKARARLDSYAHRAAEVVHECDQASWSTALQGIISATNENIQLCDIRARRASDSDGWLLRVGGYSKGASRDEVNAFRLSVERALGKAFGGEATSRFAIPGPASNSPGETATTFTIEAAVEPPTLSPSGKKIGT